MGVVVFDSDVLIGFLSADDTHHDHAVVTVRESMVPGTRRMLCAVNYSEILIGPINAGVQDTVDDMVARFGIEIIAVDMDLAQRAAAVLVRTDLKLPDAYALATAVHAEYRGLEDVRLATFDQKVLKAHAELHSSD